MCLPNGVMGKVQLTDLQIPALRRPFFMWTYNRARRFRWYREAISSLYTYGYGLFRDYFWPWAITLCDAALLRRRRHLLPLHGRNSGDCQDGSPEPDYQELVRERKDEIDRMRDIVPPEIIFGDQAPSLIRAKVGD